MDNYKEWNGTAWVPCSDVKCKDGDCGDANRYVDGNANGAGPGVYFVDMSGFEKYKAGRSSGMPSSFGVATVRTCTAWFLGARYSNGYLTAITDINWDKGPLTTNFVKKHSTFAGAKEKAKGIQKTCGKVKGPSKLATSRRQSGCKGLRTAAGVMMSILVSLVAFIWQLVVFITKIVFMVLLWLEIKVQNANVYDLYLGSGRKGLRGDTPGINHTPTTGGFFSSTWTEHFKGGTSTSTGNGVEKKESWAGKEMEDMYNGGKGIKGQAAVDNCVPKAATPPIEWWRGWNVGYNKEGYKYLNSCRGPVQNKKISYVLSGKTYTRGIKVISISEESAMGWGFGNNNYPKFQAYLFPTCFTINQAYVFGQIYARGGLDRELLGAKGFAQYFIKCAEKSTKEAKANCFKGKAANRWRYNGEREYNPTELISVGENSPGAENTVKPSTSGTTTGAGSPGTPADQADAGKIVKTRVAVNKKMCKEDTWYKDATGKLKWSGKYPDVAARPSGTIGRLAGGAVGGFMQFISTLGMSAGSQKKRDTQAALADFANALHKRKAQEAQKNDNVKVSEGGYDGFDPGAAATPANPSTCAPHAPFVYTANWGPASWNYQTVRLKRVIAGNLASRPTAPGSKGDNDADWTATEWESKYLNWARNQNDNGILPMVSGYTPEFTHAEWKTYLDKGLEAFPSDGAAAAASNAFAAKTYAGRNKQKTAADNGAGSKSVEIASMSFKFFTDDSDPENRVITPLTKEMIQKRKAYKYSIRKGQSNAAQRSLGKETRIPAPKSWAAGYGAKFKSWWGGGIPGAIYNFFSNENRDTKTVDDSSTWNYERSGSAKGDDKMRICVGGLLDQVVIAAPTKANAYLFKATTKPQYTNRQKWTLGWGSPVNKQCQGLAVIDMRPTAPGRVPKSLTDLGGALFRNTFPTSVQAHIVARQHKRQKKAKHKTSATLPASKAKVDREVTVTFAAIANAPGYNGGHKAASCMKMTKSIFGKDCLTWLEPLEQVMAYFVCDDMSFGITIRTGAVGCATPYLTSVSPAVDEVEGKTTLIGADLAFPFTVSLSFKFWMKSSWYVCLQCPLLLYIIEGILSVFGIKVPLPYNVIELEVGFSVGFHDWGKSAKDLAEDGPWYVKFCFQQPVWGPLVMAPICDDDKVFSLPKAKASCFTGCEIKVMEVNPQLSVALSMKLLGVCSFCGKLSLEFWSGNGGLTDWKCMKVGMITPQDKGGVGNREPNGLVRAADGGCSGVSVSLGKSVGRTGRTRMAYAKQARCELAQDSCHDALESKDTSALSACLKDALSSRIQCDATSRLDPYPSVGNLFAKEMDVFMGPNMGPDSATSMAALRAGYAQGLGSLRVERLSVQLTGSEGDVKLRMNATVAPATAVQLRDVCWNWDDAMMKDVRHAKADKYTTAKQKGRFLVAAVQWHLKNGSGLDQKTRENMQDWVVMVKDMGAMGFLQKDPSVESREANTLSAATSKMCSKLPLTGLRAELQMDVTSLGSGETAGQFSGSLRKFTVPLVEQGYHRTTQAQRAVESMLGGKRRFADVFGKIMREAKNIVDKEAQYLMKATCTELRVLCPTCSDEAWECGL